MLRQAIYSGVVGDGGKILEPPFLYPEIKDSFGVGWPIISENQVVAAVMLDDIRAEECGQREAGLARGVLTYNQLANTYIRHK